MRVMETEYLGTLQSGSNPGRSTQPRRQILNECYRLLTPTIFQIDPERCLINHLKQTKLQKGARCHVNRSHNRRCSVHR
jgi:hypothetical protein